MSDTRLLLWCFAAALAAYLLAGVVLRVTADPGLDCYPQQRYRPVSWTCIEEER